MTESVEVDCIDAQLEANNMTALDGQDFGCKFSLSPCLTHFVH